MDSVQNFSETSGKIIQCKAAVALEPKKPMTVMDILVGVPQVGEVRLKVLSNALCHTDIYTLDGHDPEGKFPCILGHEAVALVESVGEGVTSLVAGDLVIPCYTPECREASCIFCMSSKTNLCPKIRNTQGQGLMPDSTTRFTFLDGKPIFHFMGCSTFTEYTVVAEISAAKISHDVDLNKICMLGCGVSTGWGAVFNTCNVQQGTTVAVFGLGAVGLAVIQAAKKAGARYVAGIDINTDKFPIAQEFGMDEGYDAKQDVRANLLAKEKWGFDYTFDCTVIDNNFIIQQGNVGVMRTALEVAHRGWGESCVIGVAASGHELATRPFQLITGRVWKGTAFGGWKSRTEVPQLVKRVQTNDLNIDKYLTHLIKGLENVNESIDALHSGNCLRAVVQISQYPEQLKGYKTQIISSNKMYGGKMIRFRHWSHACQTQMTASIYIPPVSRQIQQPALIYYLSGITCTDENARTKSNIPYFAAQHNIAVVFPDTSPRDIEGIEGLSENWAFGYGAGFYLDATEAPYNKHFNMYTYVTKELPEVINSSFNVDLSRSSIMGMGGHGALTIALKNQGQYKSVSAFAPICHATESDFSQNAFKKYLGGIEKGSDYDATLLMKKYDGPHFPILIDQGLSDEFLPKLHVKTFQDACESKNFKALINYHPEYDHSYYFISSFVEQHLKFHSAYLKH